MTCLAVLMALSQVMTDKGQAAYFYGEFEEGIAVVWCEAALLSGPVEDADTVELVTPGTMVEICGPPDGSLIRNGAGTEWYPVVTDRHQGYLAGIELAMAFTTLDDGTVLACALTDRSGKVYPVFHGAVIALDGHGGVLDSVPVDMPHMLDEIPPEGVYGYCAAFEEADTEGLEGIPLGAMLAFDYGACGYANTDQLVGWDGERLVPGPKVAMVVEAGVFHWTQTMVLPSDEGGRPNEVLVVEVSEEFSEDDMAYYETARDTTVVFWDGEDFSGPDS